MSDATLIATASDLLSLEAQLLDEHRWREWLDLYREDAVFWVPAYTDSGDLIKNPELELNLIYITSKKSLEERIYRIETGDSAASTPTPRTSHMISNVIAHPLDHRSFVRAHR